MAYVEVSDPRPHVRQIMLNRPERMNAMSFDTIIPLREALEAAGQDNDCWVVVLTGKAIREYFEETLTREGATLATWIVLSGIDRGGWDNQRNLAKELGPRKIRVNSLKKDED